MAIKYQQGPVKSGIFGTVFVIDREEHVLHINCPVFQQLFDEIIFKISTFRYNTVLWTTKNEFKMNSKYKKYYENQMLFWQDNRLRSWSQYFLVNILYATTLIAITGIHV